MAVEKTPPVRTENFEQIRRDGFSFKIGNAFPSQNMLNILGRAWKWFIKTAQPLCA